MGVVSLDKHLFACGGSGQKQTFHSVEKYSIETNQWSYVCPMNCQRRCFIVIALGKYLFAIGGIDKEKVIEKVMYI